MPRSPCLPRPVLPRLLGCLALCFALLLPAAASAADAPDAPVAGTDYEVIDNGIPLAPLAGKIEVVEVFRYECPHCFEFQARLDAWKRALPKDVRFTYLPLPASPDDAFALAFFASENAGTLPRTHDAIYRAVHETHELPRNPTVGELAAFLGPLGVDTARLTTLMESPAAAQRVKSAWEFAARNHVDGTPTLIVNGTYRIVHGSHENRLRTAAYLIARERAAAQKR